MSRWSQAAHVRWPLVMLLAGCGGAGDPETHANVDDATSEVGDGGPADAAGDAGGDALDVEGFDALTDTAVDDATDGGDVADAEGSGPRRAPAIPIRGAVEGSGTVVGAPHTPDPLDEVFNPPSNPFMAAGSSGNIHNDAWMSDAYPYAGPLGVNPVLHSNTFTRVCGTTTFDSRGNIVTVCVGLDRAKLLVLDPDTLSVLATLDLPPRPSGGSGTFTDFGGGGYFYLDNLDRAVIPTTSRAIWVVSQQVDGDTTTLVREATYDLTSAVDEDDSLQSCVPDFNGNIWFVSRDAGVVGFVQPATGALSSIALDEPIANSFAADSDGAVYIASATAMYRFDIVDGAPSVTWREVYENTGEIKPGQVSAGTGTTPTLLNGGLVTITDNADPINVVVYRTASDAAEREVCAVPVFSVGASATENSLIGVGGAIFVENNFGYTGPSFDDVGPVTSPGIARIDVRDDLSGCDVVWTNSDVMAPSSVPKVSVAAGLMYVISRPTAVAHDWAWTALDVHTGDVAFSVPMGTGFSLNNNYAGIAIGPDGTAYVGVIGGIVSMRDGR